MNALNIEQNTEEWHELRRNMIGASDAPKIMGVSPWGTPFQLWEEKLGLRAPQKENYAMKYGKEKEKVLREDFTLATKWKMKPAVMVHKDYPWMMASLDGIDESGTVIVEIKCANEEDHLLAIANNIPEKYKAQCQHQMAVADVQWMFYLSSHPDYETVYFAVFRDDKYIAEMIKKEKEFYDRLESLDPPELCAKDYRRRNEQQWLDITYELLDTREKLKAVKHLETKEDYLKKQLITLAGDVPCEGGGIRITPSLTRGAVDYKSIPELQGVNLEAYRKQSYKKWYISEIS